MTVSIDALNESINYDNYSVSELKKILFDSKKYSMPERFRALFTLKNIGGSEAIDAIAYSFSDDSDLLKHELAYVLGQMKSSYAIPYLEKVLADISEASMVRHEAAEALGAIGDPQSLSILEKYQNCSDTVISETCQLAAAKIMYELRSQSADAPRTPSGPFLSVDPAPPMSSGLRDDGIGAEQLLSIMMDTTLPLFDRYRAMFSLRNLGTSDAVKALATGFKDSSALFRHEIAYVFGQLQHQDSVEALVKVLDDPAELGMVRHEAAEALGSIGTENCRPILEKYATDPNRVVRESCQVGLDMWESENTG